MKKLILSLMLMGLVALSTSAFALTGSGSSNKTLVQIPVVFAPGQTSGAPATFITGTNNANIINACQSSGAVISASGTASGYLSSCGGGVITGINISGGASGGVVAIYDASTNQTNQAFPAEVGPAEAVFEATVAANTQNYYDIHDSPISTQNGIVAIATSTSGVVVYSSPSVAVNR